MEPTAIDGGLRRLRPWVLEDAEVLHAAWADPDIRAWTAVPEDDSLGAAMRWIRGGARRWKMRLAYDLVIIGLEDEPSIVGEVGLGPIDWSRRAAQIGYWVERDHRGRGVATDAVQTLCRWAIDALPIEVILAVVDEKNPASAAVARAAVPSSALRLITSAPIRTAREGS